MSNARNTFTPEQEEWLTEQQEEWLTELETTDKIQGRGNLKIKYLNPDHSLDVDKYCCLGVAAELQAAADDAYTLANRTFYYWGGESNILPDLIGEGLYLKDGQGEFFHDIMVVKWEGGTAYDYDSLVKLNDNLKLSFKEIAKFCRTYPWAVFSNFDPPEGFEKEIPAELLRS